MRPTSRPDGPSCRLDRTLRAVRRCCTPHLSSPLAPRGRRGPLPCPNGPNGPPCRLDAALRAAGCCSHRPSPRGPRESGPEPRRWPPGSSVLGPPPYPGRRSSESRRRPGALRVGLGRRVGRSARLRPGRRRGLSGGIGGSRTPRLRARTVRPVDWTRPFALPGVAPTGSRRGVVASPFRSPDGGRPARRSAAPAPAPAPAPSRDAVRQSPEGGRARSASASAGG